MSEHSGSSQPGSRQKWIVDQAQRLAALAESGILDTPAEKAFDRIVQRASQLCEAPVALVSLVTNDRQWFKARIGFGPCETPLTQSVCKYALDEDDLLVIPDLTADPRTAENTLVTAPPHIRFYAGAQLRALDGTPIGSLCVIDTVARPEGLTAMQATALEDLALECSALIACEDMPYKRVADQESRIVRMHPDDPALGAERRLLTRMRDLAARAAAPPQG